MNVSLRNMTEADLPLILAWRNIPQVYEGAYSQRQTGPLAWDIHKRFWDNRKNWRCWIIEIVDEDYYTRPIGWIPMMNFESWMPETAIYIGEIGLWGQGIGKKALSLGLDWLRSKGYNFTRTTILDNNERSIRLYESLGFKRIANARPNEGLYMKEL